LTQNIRVVKERRGLLTLVGLFVIYFMPMILMSVSYMIIYHILSPIPDISTFQHFGIYALCCWITFVIMLLLLQKQDLHLSDIGYRGSINLSTLRYTTAFLIAGLGVITLSSLVLDCLGIMWSSYLEFELDVTNPLNTMLLIFTLIVTTPIMEETYYRAYSITAIRLWLKNEWVAGMLSCLVFAILHLPFWGLRGSIHLFLWALVPTVLFIWKESIYPCLIMHVVNNMFLYVIFPIIGWF
jgi:membrane protease YdiL (CAAX protease family)